MRKLFLLIWIVIVFFGCQNSNLKNTESSKKPSQALNETQQGKLAAIDSVVGIIDANKNLYTEFDFATVETEIVHHITYEESFEKKGGPLIKAISKDVNDSSTLIYVSYFLNEKLIKNEATIQNKDSTIRAFIYLENDIPVFFSGNVSLDTVEAIKKQSYLLLNYVKNKKKGSVP